MKTIDCFIIDDEIEALKRLGTLLSKIPEVKVVGIIQNPEEALVEIKAKKPDIVFLDVEMPRMSGFDVVTEIKTNGLRTTIIFVTGYNQYAIKAMKASAFDYLLKPVDIDELKECLNRFRKEASARLVINKSLSEYDLSSRELEILKLIATGKSSKEIAEKLYISKNTVDTHRRNILDKTGLKNSKELILLALSENL